MKGKRLKLTCSQVAQRRIGNKDFIERVKQPLDLEPTNRSKTEVNSIWGEYPMGDKDGGPGEERSPVQVETSARGLFCFDWKKEKWMKESARNEEA